MTDITKCKNEYCFIKNNCYRHTAPDDEYYQSYAYFNRNREVRRTSECEYFYKTISKPTFTTSSTSGNRKVKWGKNITKSGD